MSVNDEMRRRTVAYCAKHGTTKAWLSRQLRCTQGHLAHWLKGDRELGLERLKQLEVLLCQ